MLKNVNPLLVLKFNGRLPSQAISPHDLWKLVECGHSRSRTESPIVQKWCIPIMLEALEISHSDSNRENYITSVVFYH